MADHYEVRFTVRIPDGVTATDVEVKRWLRFHMRDGCDLPLANPLSDHEPEPVRGTFRVLPTAGFRVRPSPITYDAKGNRVVPPNATETGTGGG